MSPILRRIIQLLGMVILQAAILFISAGSIFWAGWWYISDNLGMLLAAALIMLPRHTQVIAERSKDASRAKSWDLKITSLLAIPSLGLLVVAGLDQRPDCAGRLHPAHGAARLPGILRADKIPVDPGSLVTGWAQNLSSPEQNHYAGI